MGKIFLLLTGNTDERIIEEHEYTTVIKKQVSGWTSCDTEKEWLSKLYYLRTGQQQGKIENEKFYLLEEKIVLKWLKNFC